MCLFVLNFTKSVLYKYNCGIGRRLLDSSYDSNYSGKLFALKEHQIQILKCRPHFLDFYGSHFIAQEA